MSANSCHTNSDCKNGGSCIDEECVAPPKKDPTTITDPLPPGACKQDADCKIDERCFLGGCEKKPVPVNSCNTHTDCQVTEYCDSLTTFCSKLPDGKCRADANCAVEQTCQIPPGANFGVCIAKSVVVEPPVDPCPEHATRPAGSTECICNSGYKKDGTGSCVPTGGPIYDPNDNCAILGWYSDGNCDKTCPQPDPDCANQPDTGDTTNDTHHGENVMCISNTKQVLQCDTGLSCIFTRGSDGKPAYGACKKKCNVDADCSGKKCVKNFLKDGVGICGSPLGLGQVGCDFWDRTDKFCHENVIATGRSPTLECINGTCKYICSYQGNAGSSRSCPTDMTCGPLRDVRGYSVQLSMCE